MIDALAQCASGGSAARAAVRPGMLRAVWGLAMVVSFCEPVAADWPQFRGEQGRATSDQTGLPATWSDSENVIWKTELPGFGASSPIVTGERVVLTCYSGYGLDESQPGRLEELKRHVVCLRRSDGQLAWSHVIAVKPLEGGYVDFLPQHGYATNTPVTDGQRLYVFFATSGVLALDLDGHELWRADVGDHSHSWGSSASLILSNDLVIVNAAIESGSVFALEKETGQSRWRTKNIETSFGTPVLVRSGTGREELVFDALRKLIALDPATGERLWTFRTGKAHGIVSPAAEGDMVFASTDRPRSLVAVRAGGSGDVSTTHLVWRTEGVGPQIPSPVIHGKYLYTVDQSGVMACVSVASGEIQFRQRLPQEVGKIYASPVIADGKLFCLTRDQGCHVLAATTTFEPLALNRLASDASIFNATPAIDRGQLLIRSDRFLYCLGKSQ